MKLKIESSKLLLVLLILSCVIEGLIFELVFFVSLFLLIYKNKKYIKKCTYSKKFIIIIFLYLSILIELVCRIGTLQSWRPIGITKVLCGISLCVLFYENLYKYKIESIFIIFLIIFNLLFSIFGSPIESNIGIIKLLDYPGQNTLGCLNMIALPHIIRTYKAQMKRLRLIYVLSLIILLIRNIGFTTEISVLIVVLWLIITHKNKNQKKIVLLRGGYNKNIILPSIMFLLILFFITNQNIRETYLNILSHTDTDRYTILTQAIYRILTDSSQNLLFGSGDTNFHMFSGRIICPHNFIVEIITFGGILCVVVLLIETFSYLKLLLFKSSYSKNRQAIILSTLLGYLFFLLHPVYTTSFLVKIFFVIINLKACDLAHKNQIPIDITKNNVIKCKIG